MQRNKGLMGRGTVEETPGRDNIYYNLTLVNNSSVSVPANYVQTLAGNILSDPSQWYCSIIRFSIDGSALPIFVFQPDTYYVSISFGTYNATYPVEYIPYVPANLSPEGPVVYSYQAFLQMINAALLAAFTDAAANAFNWPGGASAAPYMLLNPANGLISLYAQEAYDSTATAPIQICFNNALFYFFDNFLSQFNGEDRADKKDYQIIVQDLYGSNTSELDSSIPSGYYRMSQEYPDPGHWVDQSSIVFESNTIGAYPEYTPTSNTSTTLLTGNNQAGQGISTTNQLTDFIPAVPSGDYAQWRGQITYYPSSQYRLFDLVGSDLRQLDVSIRWRDKQSNLWQLYIPAFQCVTIKFGFFKKSLYKPAGILLS
jgi:hypothetical protein